MRRALIGLLLSTAVLAAAPANAQVRVSIGIDVPAYPQLVRIPGYPVYYAPRLDANYFFYDGLFWLFDGDNWYESPWYNGPWSLVDPYSVPVFLLRVPVRYYHVRPAYFRGWAYDAPPRWGEHWGSSWTSRHSGWDRWNRSSAPAPAPLPTYQRAYSGSRYPAVSQQQTIQARSYSYVPHETIARQQAQQVQQRRTDSPVSQRAEAVQPAQPHVQQREARRQQQFQQQAPRATLQPQAPQRMERMQQAQRAERAQQAQVQQVQRAERMQQAQVQRQERVQQPPQRAERQQQHENRGQERGEGRDRHEGG
jgi:hypothetical protein